MFEEKKAIMAAMGDVPDESREKVSICPRHKGCLIM
jgi:hypothetical protein